MAFTMSCTGELTEIFPSLPETWLLAVMSPPRARSAFVLIVPLSREISLLELMLMVPALAVVLLSVDMVPPSAIKRFPVFTEIYPPSPMLSVSLNKPLELPSLSFPVMV